MINGASILVVDDDGDVLTVTVELLRDRGFSVFATSDTATALRMLELDRAIRLLISDIIMPGTDGVQLARLARQRRPDLKILLASGYQGPHRLDALAEAGAITLLFKPFRSEQLFAAVSSALDGTPPAQPEPAQPQQARQPAAAPTDPTVLLVDDSTTFLGALRGILQNVSVLTATESASAKQAMAQPGGVSCAVIDMRLGSEAGLELARWIRQQFPHVRIALMTGYPELSCDEFPLLRKPFDEAALRRFVFDAGRSSGATQTAPPR